MWSALKRIKPDLENGGVRMDFDRTATKRTIVIQRVEDDLKKKEQQCANCFVIVVIVVILR